MVVAKHYGGNTGEPLNPMSHDPLDFRLIRLNAYKSNKSNKSNSLMSLNGLDLMNRWSGECGE